jgi:hypothetical protein
VLLAQSPFTFNPSDKDHLNDDIYPGKLLSQTPAATWSTTRRLRPIAGTGRAGSCRSTARASGTPAGIGYFHQLRVVLKDGDEISIKIDKIGTLVNKVRYGSW